MHPVFAHSFSFCPPAKRGRQIVARGIERLEILNNADGGVEMVEKMIYENLLGRIACSSTSETDRLLGQRLYKAAFGHERYEQLLRHAPKALQIDLFESMT